MSPIFWVFLYRRLKELQVGVECANFYRLSEMNVNAQQKQEPLTLEKDT